MHLECAPATCTLSVLPLTHSECCFPRKTNPLCCSSARSLPSVLSPHLVYCFPSTWILNVAQMQRVFRMLIPCNLYLKYSLPSAWIPGVALCCRSAYRGKHVWRDRPGSELASPPLNGATHTKYNVARVFPLLSHLIPDLSSSCVLLDNFFIFSPSVFTVFFFRYILLFYS